MAWFRFVLTTVFVVAGLITLSIGVFGVFRFRYACNRMHAAAINDTMGAALILIGVIISCPDIYTALKLVLVLVFLWCSSPVASHLLCRFEVETNEDRKEYMEIRPLNRRNTVVAESETAVTQETEPITEKEKEQS